MLKFSGYSRLIRGRPFWCVFLGAEVRLSRVSGGASSARRSATQLASLLRAFLLAPTRATLSFLLLVATCFSLGGRLPQHLPQRRRSGRLFWFFPRRSMDTSSPPEARKRLAASETQPRSTRCPFFLAVKSRGGRSASWFSRGATDANARREGGREGPSFRSRVLLSRPSDRRGHGSDPVAAICVQDVDVQCVLQFTLINAPSCALHRRTSRVIHRMELSATVSLSQEAFAPRAAPTVCGLSFAFF